MHKIKRWNVFLVAIVLFSLLAMTSAMPKAQAASLESLSVTLSDSSGSATATTTAAFVINSAADNSDYLTEGQYLRVTYDSNYLGNPGAATVDVTCPADTQASTTDGVYFVECVVDAGKFLESTTTQTVIAGHLQNPAGEDASYDVSVSTHDADGSELRYLDAKVYILSEISVSARVLGSLTFAVSGIGPASTRNTVNGIDLTGTSTANELSFGDLGFNATSTMGHELAVSTNATNGFSVTVQQSGELTNGTGDTINSFNNSANGTGSTSPHIWQPPLADINRTETYGHMGLTTEDDDLTDTGGGDEARFTGSKFAGLNGTEPIEVMYNPNPTNGTGENQGVSAVAYSIQISEIQEAGDYETTLTYVCTPTY